MVAGVGVIVCNALVTFGIVLLLWCTYDSAGRSWVKMKRYQQSLKSRPPRNIHQKRCSGNNRRNWRQRFDARYHSSSSLQLLLLAAWRRGKFYIVACRNVLLLLERFFSNIQNLRLKFFNLGEFKVKVEIFSTYNGFRLKIATSCLFSNFYARLQNASRVLAMAWAFVCLFVRPSHCYIVSNRCKLR